MPQAPDFRTLVTGFDSPEGPAFDAQGRLWFVNWLSSAVLRLEADGVAREVLNTGGIPAGLAFHRDGTLYIADEGAQHHGVLRLAGTPDGAPSGAGALGLLPGEAHRGLLPRLPGRAPGAPGRGPGLPQRGGGRPRRDGGVPGRNGAQPRPSLRPGRGR